MLSSRKAQGMGAAALVAIIAGLIFLYILFLPSVDREDLLQSDTEKKSVSAEDRVLLLENVGQLSVGEDLETRKDIPNVFLFETTNAKELARENPFVVRKGWFDTQKKDMMFSLSDLANTENVLLTFNIKSQKGGLTIMLNGHTIFESEVGAGNVEPIKLDKSLLQQQNTLTFAASPVGLKFWRTNEYALEAIRVVGDITDKSKQESQNVFTLSNDEYENLKDADLRFIPYCSGQTRVGALDISVNNRNIFSAVPVCEDPYKQKLPSGILNQGQNTVVFRTSSGSYSVEQIFLDFEYDKTTSKTYFFEVNDTHFNDIVDSKESVVLTLNFVDDDKDKRGVLDVNGHLQSFDQTGRTYSKTINSFLKRGNNYIRIEPETELNIIDLRVEVQKK
ncbi:TPA: hypothetical protein HA281_01415 [Candidatus Woesearchaeota archaeon]|nr:hypothetical protein [Candidatus Woesearchaeota archaeon]HIH04624.1 hypothetical protein [Candidatus Woesearchaeota archaeon]HIH91437.1 hypothetical protein [Candidatus Woesearchaeota archaeon]HII65131.1 hypothetical protein [Candidatus Woesearchaeota archaeon]HII65739.1 hypothetical protein [Candidatus Woesearchaeota archaeon]